MIDVNLPLVFEMILIKITELLRLLHDFYYKTFNFSRFPHYFEICDVFKVIELEIGVRKKYIDILKGP
jgi:hypothetical protein